MTRAGLAFSSLLLALLPIAAAAGSESLRDPTRPLTAAAPAAAPDQRSRPVLQSLLIGPDRRLAVIDGQRMNEGEERRGMKLWEIHADGVVVSVNGSARMRLSLTHAGMHKEIR